jgi:hypothetical protein
MTPVVFIGPVLTLAIWFGSFASIVLSVRRAHHSAPVRACSVSLEIPAAALLIAAVQLLLNLTLRHFGDVTVIATHIMFIGIAVVTRRRHQLPRARIHRA